MVFVNYNQRLSCLQIIENNRHAFAIDTQLLIYKTMKSKPRVKPIAKWVNAINSLFLREGIP